MPPTALATGPDGLIYVCNDGGQPDVYKGGSIQRFDLETGTLEVLYEECDGQRLSAPNDLVFDRDGGFWFTEFGKVTEAGQDKGCLFYAQPDGSSIRRIQDPLFGRFGIASPNGIGLSLNGDILYFVETFACRLYGRRLTGPGELDPNQTLDEAFLYGSSALEWLDGLAVDSFGNICIATLRSGCITVVSPDGAEVFYIVPPENLWDPLMTNICFGGPDLTDVYVTMARDGTVVRCRWPRPGAPTAFTQIKDRPIVE